MQVQAFLLLRKLHVKLNHGNVEEEEALLADLCAPTASVERGSSINLAKHAWFPATVSSPAAQGGGETGAGPSGKLKRVALVLGQSFLVRECDCFVAACVCVCVCVAVCVCVCVAVAADVCVTKVVAEIDNKPSNGPTGIAKLVVPMHHIQSLTDPRSAHVLHLRVWSAKPVLFATCVCYVPACLCDSCRVCVPWLTRAFAVAGATHLPWKARRQTTLFVCGPCLLFSTPLISVPISTTTSQGTWRAHTTSW